MHAVMGNRLDHIIKCGNPARSQKNFIKRPNNWLHNELYSPHKNNLLQKKYLKHRNDNISPKYASLISTECNVCKVELSELWINYLKTIVYLNISYLLWYSLETSMWLSCGWTILVCGVCMKYMYWSCCSCSQRTVCDIWWHCYRRSCDNTKLLAFYEQYLDKRKY